MIELWAFLDVNVQVWPQRVARVSDRGDLLPQPHALPLAHPGASLLEVPHHRVAMVADLEEDVVAIGGPPPVLPMGSSGWMSLTLTTVPSAGASTGSPKP